MGGRDITPGFLTVMGIMGTGGGGATSMTLPPLSCLTGGGVCIGGNSPGFFNVTVCAMGLLVGGGLFPVSTLRIDGMGVSPESNAGSGVGTPGGSVSIAFKIWVVVRLR